MQNKFRNLFLFIFTVSLIIAPVSAQVTTSEGTEEETVIQPTTPATGTVTPRCTRIEGEVDQVVTDFQARKTAWDRSLNDIRSLLYETIFSLEEVSTDVSQLNSDVTQFDFLRGEFDKHYNEMIDSLTTALDRACQDDEQGFVNAITSAKKAVFDMRKSAAAIQEFLNTTIRNDLEFVRKSL